jgi:hypothetical protein
MFPSIHNPLHGNGDAPPGRGGAPFPAEPAEILGISQAPRCKIRLPFFVAQAYSPGKFTPVVRDDTCLGHTRSASVDSSSIHHREEDVWDQLRPS